MALSINLVWEVRTAGHDDNGGGFSSQASGTDRSQQDSPHVTFNGTTVTATTAAASSTITITGYTVLDADVGNILKVTGGTNFITGRYEIVSVNTGLNQWTLDRNVTSGAGSGMTGRMGGAAASLGEIGSAFVGGNDVWIKSGTYNISATVNVSGGRLTVSVGGTDAKNNRIMGYETTRGDEAAKPLLQCNAASVTIITLQTSAHFTEIINLELSGNDQTTSRGILTDRQACLFRNIKFRNCTSSGLNIGSIGSANLVLGCEFVDCTSLAAVSFSGDGHLFIGCTCRSNSAGGFSASNLAVGGTLIFCQSIDNTGNGFILNGTSGTNRAINCMSKGNSGDGFDIVAGSHCINCVSTDNGGFGFDSDGSPDISILLNCAGRNNTGGNVDSANFTSEGFITLTVDPYVDPANSNFILNNAEGGGRLLKGTGLPGTFPALISTVSKPDVGAAQHYEVPKNLVIRSQKKRL